MAGQINIAGTSASVQLFGSDTITTDQAFTFPSKGGVIVTLAGGLFTGPIETSSYVQAGGNPNSGGNNGAFLSQEGFITATNADKDATIWYGFTKVGEPGGSINSTSRIYADGAAEFKSIKFPDGTTQTTAGGGGVTAGVSKIVAGTNVTISPTTGEGEVTINATGGDDVNYSVAAWGKLDCSSGNMLGSLNISGAQNIATGRFEFTFATPMPNADYSVVATVDYGGDLSATIANATAERFEVRVSDQAGNASSLATFVNFSVFATNALPPEGGTGTDAWGVVQADGHIDASFNIASVTRNDTGDYSVVFTTPMPTSNYSVVTGLQNVTSTHACFYGNKTTTGFDIGTYASGSRTDNPFSFAVNATNAQLPNTVTQEQIEAAINNPGLSAWGTVTNAGVLEDGLNIASVTKTATGTYQVNFSTPMPDSLYAVTANTIGNLDGEASGTDGFCIILSMSPTGFELRTFESAGQRSLDYNFAFQVAATNALPPKGGTGTDAWANVAADGTNKASFNIASINKIGVGVYEAVFTTAMPTANYSVQATPVTPDQLQQFGLTVTNQTVNSFRYVTRKSTGGADIYEDCEVSFAVNATNAQLPDTFTKEEIQEILDFIDEGGTGGGTGSGADAWGYISGSTGTLTNGQNIASVTRTSDGVYDVVFSTPMPNADYATVTGTSPNTDRTVEVWDQTATGFTTRVDPPTNDADINFAVFATNALPPKGGTGTDAWARVLADTGAGGTPTPPPAGFNVASVSRTGTGNYSIVFTTPMPNANYAVSASGFQNVFTQNYTTTGFDVVTGDTAGTLTNSDFAFSVNATNATLPQTVTQEQIEAAINNPGLSAWGSVAGDGSILGALNISSVVKNDTGEYTMTFSNPMPDSNYSVVGVVNSANTNQSRTVNVVEKTPTSFRLRTKNGTNFQDYAFSFQVAATNALAPQHGVGADAWGKVAMDGTLDGGFNCTSTRSSEGSYSVTFITSMPNDDYSVVFGSGSFNLSVTGQTATGFTFETFKQNASDGRQNFPTWFAVFASSTVTPTFTWTRDDTVVRTANAGDDVAVGDLSTGSLSTGSGVGLMNWGGVIATSESGNNLFIGYTKGTTTSTVNIGSDGLIQVSGDPGAAEAGVKIHPNGYVAASSSATDPVFQGYTAGSSSPTFLVKGNGDVVSNATPRCYGAFNGLGDVPMLNAYGDVANPTVEWVTTGTYRINLNQTFPNNNYCVQLTGGAGAGEGNKGPYVANLTETTFIIYTYNADGALADTSYVAFTVFQGR